MGGCRPRKTTQGALQPGKAAQEARPPRAGQHQSHLFSDLERKSPPAPTMIFQTYRELFVLGGGQAVFGSSEMREGWNATT